MPRPPQPRTVRSVPSWAAFAPVSAHEAGDAGAAALVLTRDEFEALRLADVEGLYQEEIARRMGVSRPTAARTLNRARTAVARALVEGRPLRVSGGPIAPGPRAPEACPVHTPRRAGRHCRCEPVPADAARGDAARPVGWSRPGPVTVAIPSDDGVTVAPHLGRAAGFILATITEGAIRETRRATLPPCRTPGCEGARERHARVREALRGVDALLVAGAGRPLLEELAADGVWVEFTREQRVEPALRAVAARSSGQPAAEARP